MAQNITLMGASYSDVPSVELPKTGGGTASFTDTSPTTAAAADVASGKYFFTAAGVLTLGTSSGGIEDGHVYQDQDGYIVLDDDTGKVYQSKSVSYTPSETAQSATVTADNGYDALSSVSVSVGAVSSSYVGSGITRRSSSDLTASGATVTAPAGYYASSASKSVASGSVTASATKGTVSNHSVSVTPSASVTAGYISSGATGTAVTVSASELVSGTKSITSNGTSIDVTDYAAVDVAVPAVTPTLITKSITANGTYNASSDNADGYSSVTVNVSGGGGGSGDMTDPIRFFDYDGTLVASYSSAPASLPSVPSHTGLTNGTWNYTLQELTTQFNAMGTCDVGANYSTVSGATEIDIELQKGRLHPYLSLAVNGEISIDWGDNSTSDTVTGTSLSTRKTDIYHEYAQAGEYTIKITKTSGTGYSLYCTSTYTLLNKNSSTANANRVYSNCVQAVRVGAYCSIGNNAFYNCYSLASASIPSGITSINNNAFYNCYSLAFVSIPSGVTSIGSSVFSGCYSLASISIPSGATSIGSNTFYNCYSLASVSIPSGVTSIGSSMFYYCYSLASISIPSGVTSIDSNVFYNCYPLASVSIPSSTTSIGNNAFTNCYGVAEYHFLRTESVPTLGTSAFSNIQSDCVIYVPSSKLNDYKTAENWSTYASYMVGE